MRVRLILASILFVALIPLQAHGDEIYPIVFPVAGPNQFTDTYDAPRGGGRLHEATDILADKMTPVVAAASGTVGWMSSTCCSMQLLHDDGYQSWYIHLNNDTPGTDDGQAWGFAPGIEPGVSVAAGQLIGWVGDSGNAEYTVPHLHFQLHSPDGSRFNPYPSLIAAQQAMQSDEMFFYRSTDGAFRYYDIGPDATLGAPIQSGTGYSTGWDSITAIDLDGDNTDEMFFYRSTDGAFRYYDIGPDATLGAPIQSGTGYSTGWDSITAIDLDGDNTDEMFFYRSTDGAFRYYDIGPDATLGAPIQSGTGYSTGWDSITAIDLDGDNTDEMFFYRSTDGAFRYYDIGPDATLGAPIQSGTGYSTGWDSITAIDLDGDNTDEMFFYRSTDGAFRYYDIGPDATLGAPIQSGTGYSTGWDSITAVNID